jgi:hypothetical protein
MTVVIPLTAKTPPSSRTKLLDNILSCTDYYAKLFVNELDESDLQFTEASFLGYSQVKLSKDDWRDSIIESDFAVSYYEYPVAWSSIDNNDSTIYGYYLVDDSNIVIWYQKFPQPVTLFKDRGLNIVPKIVLGCVSVPPTSRTSSKTIYGAYFRIKYSPTASDEESFVIRLNDNYKITIAREAKSFSVYVVGKIVLGQESYNSPWTFHLDPGTIDLVYSRVPPNKNHNLSPTSIEEGLVNGTFKENTEVCYGFLTSSIIEMELKGVVYCGDPLMWKSRNQKDSETNEFIQFGYCDGECAENSNKSFDDLTEVCSDIDENIYDEYISDRDEAFNAIDEYAENEYMPDIDAILAWTEEEQADFDYLGIAAEDLDIDYQLEEYRNRNPTPPPIGDL